MFKLLLMQTIATQLPALKFFKAGQETWLEKLKNWDLDLMDVVDWFENLVRYYTTTYGWIAYLVIGLAVIVVLLSNDLTHKITSQILSDLWRALMLVIGVILTKTLELLADTTKDVAVARWRDAARYWVGRMRQEDPEGEDPGRR